MSVLSRRSALPEEQRGRTREAILAATRDLLADGRAFAELSVGEISIGAGVSRPTFYAYFQDKRDLVLSLGSELEADVRAVAGPWLRDEDDDLRATLDAVLHSFRTHGATLGAIVEAATYDPEVATFWRDFHEWFLVNAAERARRADPALAAADAEALAYSLVWMTERCLTEHLSAQRVEEEPLLNAIERLWRSAIPAAGAPLNRARVVRPPSA
ncbi:HTH-type transcriptional regulator EthR [Paraconexibacter sp. AEG42_29]|uniref:HTH-type transcriptional regulator EthR n=1 Tax=Paraconexibacter sp. AEG42_29 TaxID=2997339 RepID=A0AAU7AQS3_9ACTN